MSMNRERPLLISNPPLNDNWETWFFIEDGNELTGLFKLALEEHHISPHSHPRVLELFAGDAPISYLLDKWGWTDFTCIDWKQSKVALAPPPKRWVYMDLDVMLRRLFMGGDLSEIQHL